MSKSGYKPRVSAVKRRVFAGTSKPSTSRRKMTPASLYTHYIDMKTDSPTFGQRLEITQTS